MRTTFFLGLLGLALVLLLNAESAVRERVASEALVESAGGGTSVRIFSVGNVLEPERLGRRALGQEIILNGKLFSLPPSVLGVRLVSFRLDSGSPSFRSFDVLKDPDAVERMAEAVSTAPQGTVFAMSVFRTMRPRGEDSKELRGRLAKILEELGAKTRPYDDMASSWAYLGIREEGGWRPLGERYSRTKGVMLARNLPSSPALLDEWIDVDTVEETQRVRRLLSVYGVGVTKIGYQNEARKSAAAFEINQVQEDGFSAAPPYGANAPVRPIEEHRLTFDYVELGDDPHLETNVGIESWHQNACDGVVFEVFVNGELAGSQHLDSTYPDAWIPMRVDLSPWSRSWVRLELRTRKLAKHRGEPRKWREPLVWGDPVLIDRPLSAKSEVYNPGRHAVLAMLETRPDGILMRNEMPQRLVALLDQDKDGAVTAEEDSLAFPGLVSKLDADQSGALDAEELEALYDNLDAWLFPAGQKNESGQADGR